MRLRRRFAVPFVLVVLAAIGFVTFRVVIETEAWMPTVTDDPVLIARGTALFDRLPEVDGAPRDPYGTACGIDAAAYCVWSPTMTPAELVAATGAQLIALGAGVEHRDCPSRRYCVEWYSHEGVQVSITGWDRGGRNNVFGQVMAGTQPDRDTPVPPDPARDLRVVPAGWGKLVCAATTDAGCVRYQGRIAGPETPAQARDSLRQRLIEAGYRLDVDECSKATAPLKRCNLGGSRYRALGGHDGITVIASVRTPNDSTQGFSGFIAVGAEPWTASNVDAGQDRPASGESN